MGVRPFNNLVVTMNEVHAFVGNTVGVTLAQLAHSISNDNSESY